MCCTVGWAGRACAITAPWGTRHAVLAQPRLQHELEVSILTRPQHAEPCPAAPNCNAQPCNATLPPFSPCRRSRRPWRRRWAEGAGRIRLRLLRLGRRRRLWWPCCRPWPHGQRRPTGQRAAADLSPSSRWLGFGVWGRRGSRGGGVWGVGVRERLVVGSCALRLVKWMWDLTD
jgi:hypothetical protein